MMRLFRARRKQLKLNVTMLGYVALSEKLREYEDEHELRTGQRLSTAEFYDRYRRGEATDVADAIEWSSYYEMLREFGRQAIDEQKSTSIVSPVETPPRSVAVA